jgi:rhamnosyltransferase
MKVLKGRGIMLKSSNSKFISVFIPTFNGEKYIVDSIEWVLKQELPDNYSLDFIIIDSGSKDKTVELIKPYLDKITFLQIPNSEYGHGKTRQKASEMAKGEYILFLSQDATPSHTRWIKNMIEPFYVSDKVGCVFGRQIPRPDAVASIKKEVSSVFGRLGAADAITLHRQKSLVDGYQMNILNTFFSDVNSAVRKDLIMKVPFRDVAYAEDQALAEDMQNAGYLKAYSAQGAVWHSNEYTVKEFHKRKFDEYIGLQESVDYKINPSAKSLLLGWIRPTLDDIKFIKHDEEYGRKEKIKQAVLSFGYNYMSGLGKYHAGKYLNNPEVREKISLEATRKK